MNAATQTEFNAVAADWTKGNPFRRNLETEHPAVTFPERVREMAEDDFLTPENIGEAIACASTERESSVYWGPISTAELVKIMFGRPGNANAEQIEQARITFRRRLFAEHAEAIAEIETRLSIGADAGLGEQRS